jgi:AcrR family transcriptional regulator
MRRVTKDPGARRRRAHAGSARDECREAAWHERKSDATRDKIVSAAMKLFRARGYERTTMSLIAARAKVSKGNAYYYFKSKEELIQFFYDELQAKHRALVDERLPAAADFEARLRVVLLSWQEVAKPYHEFGDKLFKNAASPESPLSPFSPESKAARDAAIEIMRVAVAGSGLELDDETREALVQGLWFAHMGLVLFWVFDRSDGQAKTKAAVERVVPLVAAAVGLVQTPFFEDFRPQLVGLVREIATGLQI